VLQKANRAKGEGCHKKGRQQKKTFGKIHGERRKGRAFTVTERASDNLSGGGMMEWSRNSTITGYQNSAPETRQKATPAKNSMCAEKVREGSQARLLELGKDC